MEGALPEKVGSHFIITKAACGCNGGGGHKIVKMTRIEFALFLLTAACLAFFAGWYLRGSSLSGEPVLVETQFSAAQDQESTVSPSPASTEESTDEVEMVNINTADSATLQTLPGIGEKRAEAIIAYREENGPFRTPEELTDVSGIGEGILEGLIEYVTVS